MKFIIILKLKKLYLKVTINRNYSIKFSHNLLNENYVSRKIYMKYIYFLFIKITSI